MSELENEWVFYVNQTAHAICRQSFRQSLDFFLFFAFRFSFFAFRFSFFAFRFSFFAFRFSIIGLCHVVTVICVHEYVSVLVSELESELVSVLRQSNSSCHMQTLIWSKSRFFSFFRFSFFAFCFSLFDNRSASCFYCLVSEYMSECKWASEWVRKWVSVLRQSNSSCHMQTFISSKSSFFLFFAFRFSLFAFRFSLFDH